MNIQYVDVHTHINLAAFDDDRSVVMERTAHEGVAYINVGTEISTSKKAVELTRTHSGVYATVGLHPVHTSRSVHDMQEIRDASAREGEVFSGEVYRALALHEGVVAIGECGLDYFRVEKDTKSLQERAFIGQIELANSLNKPLMLHIRPSVGSMDAYEDALSILKTHAKVLGNVHFFAGTYGIAKQFWDMGYTTSFTGVITFASQYDEVIQNAPLTMLHAETDAPYVAPKPFRGKRNEPLHVRTVYERIATLRGEREEDVRQQLLQNARRVFSVVI